MGEPYRAKCHKCGKGFDIGDTVIGIAVEASRRYFSYRITEKDSATYNMEENLWDPDNMYQDYPAEDVEEQSIAHEKCEFPETAVHGGGG